MNRTIIGILRKFVKDYPNKWSQNLGHVTYVINTSVSESTGHTPYSLVYGVEPTDILDLCLPDRPDNVPTNLENAYKYWFDNLTLIRRLARENNIRAKLRQKLQYDKQTRPHGLKVGDKVFIKVQGLRENEDIQLRQQFKGVYKIDYFLSPTNVMLSDEHGKQLSRSIYINNLKKYNDRKNYGASDNHPDRLSQEEAQSDDDNIYVSVQSGNEDVTQQSHEECDVDDDVENHEHQHHDDGGVDHEDVDATQQQPLSDKSVDGQDDHEHSDSGNSVVDLPFCDLDDKSFHDTVDDLEDNTHGQDQPVTENNGHEIIKKVYRKIVLPSGDMEYYLSWAKYPSKKYRCWS